MRRWGRYASDPVAASAASTNRSLRSHSVFNGKSGKVEPIQGVQRATTERWVCASGVNASNECGKVLGPGFIRKKGIGAEYQFIADILTKSGDSGGPVWDPITHKAAGLIRAGTSAKDGECWKDAKGRHVCTHMLFVPLKPGGGSVGVLPKLGVELLRER